MRIVHAATNTDFLIMEIQLFQVDDRILMESVNVDDAAIEVDSDKSGHIRLDRQLTADIYQAFRKIVKLTIFIMYAIVAEKAGLSNKIFFLFIIFYILKLIRIFAFWNRKT